MLHGVAQGIRALLSFRKGETKWEDLELDDIDVRLKWSGMFHRRKRAPGTFMMRLKVPICMLLSVHW